MENLNAYEKPVTLKNIVKFAVPTIAMTVFMSFYTMVDGLFVSNLIGTDALSAINLTAPVIQLVTAVSTMLATGYLAMDFIFAGLFVFSRKKSLLHFKKPVFRIRVLGSAASNGCSEMATALVTGIVTMMFNWTMLHYVGEDGVAAVTIIMYVLMFASSLYTGYSYGVAPMLSFYYGEQNHEKLKKLVGLSMKVIAVISVITAAASFAPWREWNLAGDAGGGVDGA